MARWTAFIDETGDFSASDGDVGVAAWLCRTDGRELRLLEQRLTLVAPWLPRPLHTYLLRRPSWHACCMIAAGTEAVPEPWARALGTTAAALGEALEDLRGRFAANGLEAAALVERDIGNGREPDLRLLQRIEASSSWRGSVFREQHGGVGQQAVAATRGALLETMDTWSEDERGALVAAFDDVRHAQLAAKDRYLALLRALLRAINQHVERVDPDAEVVVEVATRRVLHPALGVTCLLNTPLLDGLVAQARPPGAAAAAVRGGIVSDFRTTAPGGLFIVDLGANCLAHLTRRSPTWARIDEQLRGECGLGATLGALPAIIDLSLIAGVRAPDLVPPGLAPVHDAEQRLLRPAPAWAPHVASAWRAALEANPTAEANP